MSLRNISLVQEAQLPTNMNTFQKSAEKDFTPKTAIKCFRLFHLKIEQQQNYEDAVNNLDRAERSYCRHFILKVELSC